MKFLFIYILLFINIIRIEAQEDKYIDSIVNVIDRMTTDKLNRSDTNYIDDLIVKMKINHCEILKSELLGHSISFTVKSELVKRSIDENLCYETICDYINLYTYNQHANDFNLLSIEYYPIYHLLNENYYYRRKVVDYLITSNYLNDCTYLLKHDNKHLAAMYSILTKDKIIKVDDKMDKCKQANIILIMNSFKSGSIIEDDYNKNMMFPIIPDKK